MNQNSGRPNGHRLDTPNDKLYITRWFYPMVLWGTIILDNTLLHSFFSTPINRHFEPPRQTLLPFPGNRGKGFIALWWWVVIRSDSLLDFPCFFYLNAWPYGSYRFFHVFFLISPPQLHTIRFTFTIVSFRFTSSGTAPWAPKALRCPQRGAWIEVGEGRGWDTCARAIHC